MKTKRTKGRVFFDLALIFFLLLTAGAAFLLTAGRRTEGAVVVVKIDGEPDERYPLSVNGVYSLHGGTNILTVQDGWAYMSEADCPDQLCIRQGKIQTGGEWIVCLPNRVAVTIEGNDTADGADNLTLGDITKSGGAE